MWNLEKWYRRTYLQDSDRDTDASYGHVNMGAGRRAAWDRSGIWHWHVYTPCTKETASGKLLYGAGSAARCSVMTQRGRLGADGKRGPRRRGCVYTHSCFTLLYGRNLTQHCKASILYLKKEKEPVPKLTLLMERQVWQMGTHSADT